VIDAAQSQPKIAKQKSINSVQNAENLILNAHHVFVVYASSHHPVYQSAISTLSVVFVRKKSLTPVLAANAKSATKTTQNSNSQDAITQYAIYV
jgi:hypothetical protein